jgi:hypothetical protein
MKLYVRPSILKTINSVHPWGLTKGRTSPLEDKFYPWGPGMKFRMEGSCFSFFDISAFCNHSSASERRPMETTAREKKLIVLLSFPAELEANNYFFAVDTDVYKCCYTLFNAHMGGRAINCVPGANFMRCNRPYM